MESCRRCIAVGIASAKTLETKGKVQDSAIPAIESLEFFFWIFVLWFHNREMQKYVGEQIQSALKSIKRVSYMDKIWLLNKDSEEEGSENDSDLKKSRASMRLKDLIPTLHK